MTRKRAAIIGCGPSGVLACHAAVLSGCSPTVFAPIQRSYIHGAQYLHSYIPEADLPDPFTLTYHKHGTGEGYQRKIYGSKDVVTSWGKFPAGPVIAWDLGELYRSLFSRYRALMRDVTIQVGHLQGMIKEFDYVVNTAPLHAIAPVGEFSVEYVWIAPYDVYGIDRNTIHYFGDEEVGWYRVSNINGVEATEWPDSAEPPADNAKRIPKPLTSTASTPGIHRLGRYGKWQKGVLVDHVFNEAMEIFQRDQPWRSATQAVSVPATSH